MNAWPIPKLVMRTHVTLFSSSMMIYSKDKSFMNLEQVSQVSLNVINSCVSKITIGMCKIPESYTEISCIALTSFSAPIAEGRGEMTIGWWREGRCGGNCIGES